MQFGMGIDGRDDDTKANHKELSHELFVPSGDDEEAHLTCGPDPNTTRPDLMRPRPWVLGPGCGVLGVLDLGFGVRDPGSCVLASES